MMFGRLTWFAAAVAALAAAVPAHAERLVVSLSAHRVLINSSFTGAEPVLFGVIERDAGKTRGEAARERRRCEGHQDRNGAGQRKRVSYCGS